MHSLGSAERYGKVDVFFFVIPFRELFVEEELKGSYGRLIAFVRDTEALLAGATPNAEGKLSSRIVVMMTAIIGLHVSKGLMLRCMCYGSWMATGGYNIDARMTEGLVREFAGSWKVRHDGFEGAPILLSLLLLT